MCLVVQSLILQLRYLYQLILVLFWFLATVMKQFQTKYLIKLYY